MSDLKTELELARALFGPQSSGGLGVRRVTATATSGSSDGTVSVDVGGEVVEVPVIGAVSTGDEVQLLVDNGAPIAVAATGWGDQLQTEVDTASAIASATNQHFFADTSGVHVTEQDGDAETGPNVLLNSVGMVYRYDTDELVSIERRVSGTAQGGVLVFNPDGTDGGYIEGFDGHTTIHQTDGPVDVVSEPQTDPGTGHAAVHMRLVDEPDANGSGIWYIDGRYAGSTYRLLQLQSNGKLETNGIVAKPHGVFDQTLTTNGIEVQDAIGGTLFRVAYDGTIESSAYGVSTVSGWTVERRPGGIIEATRTITGSLAVTTSYAGQYISTAQSTSLPSGLFTTIDWAGVEVSYSPGLWDAHLTSVTTSSIGYYIACNASTTANITRRIYVRGR